MNVYPLRLNALSVSAVGVFSVSVAMVPVPPLALNVTAYVVTLLTVSEYVHVPEAPLGSLSVPETV